MPSTRIIHRRCLSFGRSVVREQEVTITTTYTTFDITQTPNPDGLWLSFRTANKREDGTFYSARFQYELVMAEDDAAVARAGNVCNRPSPPPSPSPLSPSPPSDGYVVPAGVVAAAVTIPTGVLIALIVCAVWMVRRERMGKPIFRQFDVDNSNVRAAADTPKV
jgi:hypothetical protein